jgi:hypothetical protein
MKCHRIYNLPKGNDLIIKLAFVGNNYIKSKRKENRFETKCIKDTLEYKKAKTGTGLQ